ncbi:MAG: efflux RND transporter periplasmic adaptor subunit [Deltaproteobacteria bacterium]|jgi:Cu(I)/Ag(I) efflux system membrane fusion protein|nr:efflux RND transporter periplasmic adaptor subunit [Deltaproteobacteria bacterium]
MFRPIFVTALICLLSGGVFGYVFSGRHNPDGRAGGTDASGAVQTERRALYWYDPMYPGTHFDQPGKSPFMDMELIPRYAQDEAGAGVRIDPTQTQNLAVRTARAERGRLSFTRDIPANVEYNAYQLAKVQPRAGGFVEKVYSLAVGDTVRAGAPLAEITVPEWAADQSEYLLLKNQKADAAVVRGVRERLRLSGIPEEMLKELDTSGRVQTRMTIQAPLGGVITVLDVYPGMNVDKNMTMATIQGTNPIWITADVPERDIPLVASGGRMRISVPAWPERVFYPDSFVLLPQVSQDTRTVPLRLSLSNADGLLKPGMTASIRLRGSGEEAILIPTQSLIDLGEEQRVITRAADGGFAPKIVRVMRHSRDKTALAEGLEEGEEVVVSGLFLIDSEANLRGALERMRRNNEQEQAQGASVPAAGPDAPGEASR